MFLGCAPPHFDGPFIGVQAPLPKHWKPCKTKDTEDIYYFNFQTGESTWDHPCDGYYKGLYEEEKKKKEIATKVM